MAATEKRRLLVVDDETDVCEAVRKIAEGLDFDVRVMVRSRDFEAVYDDYRPDVVMLDIVMPELDGVEILKHLAAQQAEAEVIVMTGYNGSYLEKAVDLGRGLGLPAIAGMHKPLTVNTVRSALRANGKNKGRAKTANGLATS